MTDRPSDDVVPPLNDEESQVDEAFALYLKACDSGEIDSREEFLSRFPHLSAQLRELMDAADLIGQYTHTGDQLGAANAAKQDPDEPEFGERKHGEREQGEEKTKRARTRRAKAKRSRQQIG
ncbi:hypothetical protein [Rhodopirellula sallentina]|uniref:Uncharacterized protein n=1 Tax=Rhodopirellula sallentina SM41 TaxID=1263870 RepID=M5U625_9BACT|nr:hypothetical protein RSSM_01675 [Rhodopirellula sallentina SM41]